eukprot:CAMPEP_0172457490 /NCGR_PEP_ID=MMETSP1065-20121228/22652_1 /TAXON_ID=265537 /ORGANISM="Amphiprora paludosa, Strain CCMP125" /LENGTH=136 /DNA_ID=CAMNT_0013211277 /DNA_START=33 /DNA_END=443 /DNA_ORIENTATION=-
MNFSLTLALSFFVFALTADLSQAFATTAPQFLHQSTCLSATQSQDESSAGISRSAFFSVAAAAAASAALPAFAADSEASKGTKKDPAFEACLSKCMYECTKPKVDGQKTRKECLPDCKKECATTSEQLLLGSPIKK